MSEASDGVDYLGAYRNHRDQGERFRVLADLPPAERPRPLTVRYQRSRRLSPIELAKLGTGYQAGRSVYDLSREFGIKRQTVAKLLRRHGVELRYRRLTEEQLAESERLHDEGWSFVRLGERYGVDQSTVWAALRRRATRPGQGRPRAM